MAFATMISFSLFASIEIECNRGLNLISGDRAYNPSAISSYKEIFSGVFLYDSSFDLGNGEKVIFSVTSQKGKHYLMARLQKEENELVKVLGYGETNTYQIDPQGNIEISLVVTNINLMQKLVNHYGKDSSQFKLMRSFNGGLGMDSLKSVEVSCQISGFAFR